MSEPRPAGVILAAGRGTRMGRPKALLRWGATTFIGRAVKTWAAVCDPIVVVGGARFREVEAEVPPTATAVFNPAFEGGMFTSVQTGVGALPQGVPGVMLSTVDQPLEDAGLLVALAAAWRETPTRIVIPTHEGRRGHPIILPSDLLGALAAEPDWSNLRRFIDDRADRVRTIELDRPEILRNLNTPEDYRAFMAQALLREREGLL